MHVIPVIDLLGGKVVRGIAGQRHEYRAILSSLVNSSEPAAIAAALQEHFQLPQIYVADLDAITRGQPDMDSWQAIAAAGFSLLLDAGIATAADGARVWEVLGENKQSRLVVGLESITSLAELPALSARYSIPPARTILSLDMRQGVPLARDSQLRDTPPAHLVQITAALGIRQFILLDLADVGTGRGTSTLPLLTQLCEEFPDLSFIAGGGVRGRADLQALHAAGAAGALVASALHDGRLTAADCRAFER